MLRKTSFACGSLLALWAASASAQQEQRPAGTIAPLEVLECRYREQRGPADLTRLADGFNAWMERYDAPPYAAYVISPISHSEEIDFDLAWLGSWPDGTTMGRSMSHYFEHGAELGPVFDRVMTCASNTNYAVDTIQAPATPGVFGPLEVASCRLADGVPGAEARAAIAAWSGYAQQHRSGAAHWMLYPAYGERSDAAYDFKWAVGYASYEDWGGDYEQFANGGGRAKFIELVAPVVSCDTSRLYSVTPIRPAN